MLIGGVLLGAGMELNLHPGDYTPDADRTVHFVIERIVGRTADRVMLVGCETATATQPWRQCRVAVQIVALKRSLGLQ